MIIKRIYGITKNTYTIEAEASITGTSRNTHVFLPHSIFADDVENKFSAKQTNFMLKLLGGIPVINLVVFAPFKCYLNNIYLGRVTKKCFKPQLVFEMENNVYELILHTGDIIEVSKNGEQIVCYKKETYSRNEEHIYEVKKKDDKLPYVLIMAFCIFADAVFYPSRGFASNKHEKTFVFNRD